MPERILPDRLEPERLPDIETPVIDIQDLEYNASPETRVSNKGVKVRPTDDEPIVTEEISLAGDDEQAREAIRELEEEYRKLAAS